MLALLGLIPGVLSAVTSYFQRRTDAQVEITKAKIGGDTDKAKELVKLAAVNEHESVARLGIVAGSRILTVFVVAFGGILLLYFGKCIVWDKVLGLGATDPITDPMLKEWANTVIYFIFGAPTALAITNKLVGR